MALRALSSPLEKRASGMISRLVCFSRSAGFRFFQDQGFQCHFLFVLYFQTNATTNLSKAFCTHLKGLRGDNDTDTILKIITQIF